MWECLSREKVHEGIDLHDLAIKIRDKGITPKIPKGTDKFYRKIFAKCWKLKSDDRPTFAELNEIFGDDQPAEGTKPDKPDDQRESGYQELF